MLSNFAISNNKILIKNTGEYFGALGTFEYNIGDKLYEFATMEHESFDKLKAYYNQYNHQKKFTENKFKEWSKKASKLRDTYTDEQIEEFKNKLNELSALYYK